MKKLPKFAHTPKTKKGMGDSYGSGLRNPVGRPVDISVPVKAKSVKMGKPPKSLV